MNTLLLSLGLLMQCSPNGTTCASPTGMSGCNSASCHNVCSPCYGSSCWGCCTLGESHSISRCGCIQPIGDLHQHYPYSSHPKTYYYFRPYQYSQVRELATQAETLGAHPKVPFSNALFQDAYQAVEAQFIPAQPK